MLRAKFGVLRQILLDLGLTMHVTPKSVRFDDAEGRTLLLMPPYADDEEVYAGELVAARHHLDMRTLLSREQFDELLRQKLVAG